ncbi:hypothetical protein [Luteibacter mycovicinus]|uniref:hypothetical protein n=1 Tax=Luteibacter mycovicinus TaxID=1500890 RepID=UPI00055B1532|nr:hypothetical protein [Luteibacter sp. 9143a]
MHTCSSSSAPVAGVVAHLQTRHGGSAIIKHAGAHYLSWAAVGAELNIDPAKLMQRFFDDLDALGTVYLNVPPYQVDGRLVASAGRSTIAAIPLDRLLVLLTTIYSFPLLGGAIDSVRTRDFKRVIAKAIRLYPDDPRGVPAAPTSPPDASGTPEKRVLVLQIELDGGIDLPPNEVIGEALIKTLGAVLAASQPTAAPTRH